MIDSETDLHTQLIQHAARWLESKGHSVVITDMSHGDGETADAIGWKGKASTLIECKASRADFLQDRHKPWRRDPDRGMGTYRYFAAPEGMIKVEDLPERWGLLELSKGKLKLTIASLHHQRGVVAETSLLTSALRRVAHQCPKGIAVRCYTIETTKTPRATLGVLPLTTNH